MDTDTVRPNPPPLLSYPKAASSGSRSPALPSQPTLLSPPHPSSHTQLQRNASRDDQDDLSSDRATVNLIRRVLCPQSGNYGASTPQSLEELLPPLSSSNEVDRQLYALVAIIIKEFVYSWYSKITTDQVFVQEILQVIAHCTRALEQRLRQVDVPQLLLDEIPALVEAHITSYRLAQQQSKLSGLPSSRRAVYHALNPHPSFSPVPDPSDPQTVAQQQENEALYRQLLAQGVLAVLLPTEDLKNGCLTALVGDILADLILGEQVSQAASEGWFLWEVTTKLIDVAVRNNDQRSNQKTATTEELEQSRLEKFGLLSSGEVSQPDSTSHAQSKLSVWMWSVLQSIYLAYIGLRFVATGLIQVASSPLATVSRAPTSPSLSTAPISTTIEAPSSSEKAIGKRPVLEYRVFGMVSQLIDVPGRMPWLGGSLGLLQYLILMGPGRLGDADGVLDRFLHSTINDYFLNPTLLPNLLLVIRGTLFPGNTRPAPVAGGGSQQPPTTAAAGGASSSSSPHVSVSWSTESGPGPTASDTTAKKMKVNNHGDGGDGSPASLPATATTVPVPVPLASILPTSPSQGQSQPSRRPSGPEILVIKRQCAARILSLIPHPVALRLFGAAYDGKNPEDHEDKQSNEEQLKAIEEDILDLFADEYCNKHLIYSILETVLAKLLPEMSDRSVTELMEDRGAFQ
ncbi:hypothetical protein ASPZODRAFT_131207 [Penicilliopsis zonata CBS 506.65]|uniref:PXA domain-containing protein n=1 Tax=Penicilliopsis zonata CBS 506.65 TaxID=1073090 RepID=A0A1L9SKM4_9EURO|nr:hypothetical protein ASPZODRAFT_131207 [Penicilliopsis zonata CBS 506.65]OJJ47653.1 hypothetical protein ASPZODRAFT_131207 [Penicilliopsis zonata CBS 506.65]